MKTLSLDGAAGEGGGQILRTALALSCLTGTPFRLDHLRAGRSKPGLLRQHLAAVRAAGEISHARISGDALGSTALEFRPSKITGGDYHFSVGSAGSALLVLQTVLLPLLHADTPSTLTLEGGTHNPWAPPFPFIEKTFLPLLRQMGFSAEVELRRAGFYPAGGGVVAVTITPGGKRRALQIGPRGEISSRLATGAVANLPRRIAETEVACVREKLDLAENETAVEELADAPGQGNAVFLALRSHRVTEVFSAFGSPGVPARQVAEELISEARRYLKSKAAVGPHLADQLLLPLALAKGGSFTTLTPTPHTLTNIDTIQRFLPVRFTNEQTGHIDHTLTVSL